MPRPILEEFEQLHAAWPDLRQVELLFPDINGILRGKRCTLDEFRALARDGLPFPASGLILDSRGMLVDGLPHGSQDGDPDHPCFPVPGSLLPVPWAQRPLAQVLMGMQQADGRAHVADSRQRLAAVLERFADLGLRPVVAVEFEFYLLEDPQGEQPQLRHGRVPGTMRRAAGPRAYSIEDLQELDGLFDAIRSACDAQRIPAGSVVSEYGAGQFEVNLRHVDDALLACDHAVLLRRLLRGVAAREGLAVTFMAKPFAAADGSGMHVHVSLLDTAGRNVFALRPDDDRSHAAPLRHAIGGMLAVLPESQAVFCPNANSYRRIRPGCFAPVAADWGVNHRGVAIRIPVSDAASLRFEHRVAGADCNPYLAVAALLAGVHHGIVQRLEPPPGVPEGAQAGVVASLSRRWEPALDAFDAGRILPGYLGEAFCRLYSTARRFEAEAYHAQVPGLDFDWYLPGI
ncbi:MAG: glutamine synthetase family protein [Gammaproteobacteria bacterium]|nr:glutamine synthetase family protein [Gammaproteobacteria bacterium]